MNVISCYATCWACKFGHCYAPPQQHPWWDGDDVDAAKAAGDTSPKGDCACPCAHPK